jgi:hypothetical protein
MRIRTREPVDHGWFIHPQTPYAFASLGAEVLVTPPNWATRFAGAFLRLDFLSLAIDGLSHEDTGASDNASKIKSPDSLVVTTIHCCSNVSSGKLSANYASFPRY